MSEHDPVPTDTNARTMSADGCYKAMAPDADAGAVANLGSVNLLRADARVKIYRTLFPFRPRSIADIGCGVGLTTAALKRAYPDAEVVGYELSETAVEHATRHDTSGARYQALAAGEDVSLDHPFDCLVFQEFYPFTRTGNFAVHREFLAFAVANMNPNSFSVIQLAVRHPDQTILNTLSETRAFCAEHGLDLARHPMPYDRLVDLTGSVGLSKLLSPLAAAVTGADERTALILRRSTAVG